MTLKQFIGWLILFALGACLMGILIYKFGLIEVTTSLGIAIVSGLLYLYAVYLIEKY